MKSTVTVKYQTTIPKSLRERMGINVHDVLDWEEVDGQIIVRKADRPFLRFRNSVAVGAGDVSEDIRKAREAMGEEAR